VPEPFQLPAQHRNQLEGVAGTGLWFAAQIMLLASCAVVTAAAAAAGGAFASAVLLLLP
jgi:hypothetical protein